jgi:hypothetical protein
MTFNMSDKTKVDFHKWLEEIAKNAPTVLQLYSHDKLVDMFQHEISGDPKSRSSPEAGQPRSAHLPALPAVSSSTTTLLWFFSTAA